MIIHCLSCGKSISTHSHSCPYCFCEITDLTLEMNGLQERGGGLKTRVRDMVLGLVHR